MKQPSMEVELTLNVPPRRPRRSARPKATEAPTARPVRLPRIARLMALAIKFQDMVDRGEVCDYANLASLGYVSRARITQIMNLLNLAPDIQERLLCLQGDALHEAHLRPVAAAVSWEEQRKTLAKVGKGLDFG